MASYAWAWAVCVFFIAFRTVDGADTIDIIEDTASPENHSSPIYSPSGVWKQNQCDTCLIAPDNRRSWTAAIVSQNQNASIQLSFHGTGISIFFILADTGPRITRCSFDLDGRDNVTTYRQQVSITQAAANRYDQEVFSIQNLDFDDHTVTIRMDSRANSTYAIFDYARYTVPSTEVSTVSTGISSPSSPTASLSGVVSTTPFPSPSSESLPIPAIVGIVAGSVVGVLIFCVCIFGFRRRHRQHGDNSQPSSEHGDNSTSLTETTSRSPFPLISAYPNSIVPVFEDAAGGSAKNRTSLGLHLYQDQQRLHHQRDASDSSQAGLMSGRQSDVHDSILSTTGQDSGSSPQMTSQDLRSNDSSSNLAEIQDRLRAAEARIAVLQTHHGSSLEVGRSEEPPPRYEPRRSESED